MPAPNRRTAPVDPVGLALSRRDAHRHTPLIRLPERVRELPEILLRKVVDLVLRTLVYQPCRPRDAQPAERILGIDDGQADPRIAREVPRLRATVRRVERDAHLVHVDPDDGRVRRPVRAERGHDADERVLQELVLLLRQLGHAGALLIGATTSSTTTRRGSHIFPNCRRDVGDLPVGDLLLDVRRPRPRPPAAPCR